MFKRKYTAKPFDLNKVKPLARRDVRLYLNCENRNLKLNLTDPEGNSLFFFSNGMFGLKHTKKKTPLSTEDNVRHMFQIMKVLRVENVDILLKGFSFTRGVATKFLVMNAVEQQFNVTSIEDRSPVRYGGCKPRKAKKKRKRGNYL